MKCKVLKKVKGGYLVSIDAFVPGSESAGRWSEGDVFDVLVKEVKGKGNQVILSHKYFIDQSASDFIDNLKVGDIMDGKIKEIREFGFFIDLGSLDGLAHKNDGNPHPRYCYYEKGHLVRVKVLSIDKERQRIALKILCSLEIHDNFRNDRDELLRRAVSEQNREDDVEKWASQLADDVKDAND